MIQLNNLSKTFIKDGNAIEVLKNLDFTISRGESLAILGVSGAGKSTSSIFWERWITPHQELCSLRYRCLQWDKKKLAEFRNKTVGFVFQFHNLLPEFNSLENTMMPALIHGLPYRKAESGPQPYCMKWDSETG